MSAVEKPGGERDAPLLGELRHTRAPLPGDAAFPDRPIRHCGAAEAELQRQLRRPAQRLNEVSVHTRDHATCRDIVQVPIYDMPRAVTRPKLKCMAKQKPSSEQIREIAFRVLVLRTALDMTQGQIAEQAGVGRTTWTAWEKGQNSPDYLALTRLANFYGFSLNYITQGTFIGTTVEMRDKLVAAEEKLKKSRRPA